MIDPYSYSIYFDFIDTYLPSSFNQVNRDSPIIERLEEVNEENDQFFYIADLTQLKLLYTSKRSLNMVGIPPEKLDFSQFMDLIHPDDEERLSLGRSKLLKKAQDLFFEEKGSLLLSTNMRLKNPSGGYTNMLLQNYLFFSSYPRKTVYFLKVHTNVDSSKKIRCGFHYYIGEDRSKFRFPDDKLLNIGPLCTEREIEIVRLIEEGLNTKEIADKLFVSHHTVSKHRSNILEKSGKTTIWDLILDLKKEGIL